MTREGLAKLALLRREEFEGFVEGVFGENESLDLPERARRAMGILANIRAMMEPTRAAAEDHAKLVDSADIAGTLRELHEITRIAEHEMHEAVLSCTRARRQMMRAVSATKPIYH